jgi:hypothetical protein
MPMLFDPVAIGPYRLSHRVVMAPLTRMRAGLDGVPSRLAATYYAQRATEGGLIITEATVVSPRSFRYVRTPGIFTLEQVAAWRTIVQAVHARRGCIFLQLWHVGRQSHPSLQPQGQLPIAPSALAADGRGVKRIRSGSVPGAARAADRRDSGARCRIPAGRGLCAAGRVRRSRDPCCERISSRPVSSGRIESSHRFVWWDDRESRPLPA